MKLPPVWVLQLRLLPDDTVEYACEGEDLPFDMPNWHGWVASKRVYQNLANVILVRPWERTARQEGAGGAGRIRSAVTMGVPITIAAA